LSSEDKYKQRYYYKESYEVVIVTFATAIILLFVAILSLIFIAIPFYDPISLHSWGFWLFIPAFFIFIGGFQQLYRNMKYQQVVKNAIAQRNYEGTHKLEHIAIEIGIKPKDLLRVLLDLRNKNKIKYKFNPDTGEIVLGESVSYTPSVKKPEVTLAKEDKSFCVYCGQKLDGEAIFCPSCGSKL